MGQARETQDQQHGQIRHSGNNGKRGGQLTLGWDARRVKSRWGNKSQDPGEKEAMEKGSTSEEEQISNSKFKQTRQSEESRERKGIRKEAGSSRRNMPSKLEVRPLHGVQHEDFCIHGPGRKRGQSPP